MGLQGFRDQKNSGLIVGLFVVIIFVFIFMFGLPSTDLFGGGSAKKAAKINDHVIDADLMRSMALRTYGDRISSTSDYPALMRDLANRISLVYLLADEARLAGLRVSEQDWQRYLQKWENGNEDIIMLRFLNKHNAFSKKAFESALYSIRMSPREYRNYKENELLAYNYLTLMASSVAVNDKSLWSTYTEITKSADLSFIRLTSNDIRKVLKPITDEDVANFLAANLDAVRGRYDEKIADYTTPEKLKMQEIVIQKYLSNMTNVGSETNRKFSPDQRFAIIRRKLIDEHLEFEKGFAAYDEALVKAENGIAEARDIIEIERMYNDEGSKESGKYITFADKKVGDIVETELRDMYIIAKIVDRSEKIITPFDDVKLDIARQMLDEKLVADKLADVSNNIIEKVKSGTPLDEALNSTLYAGVVATPTIISHSRVLDSTEENTDSAAVAENADSVAVAENTEAAEAAPAPEPVYAKDEIIVPLDRRVKVQNKQKADISTANVAGIGISNDLAHAVRNTANGTILDKTYEVNGDTYIVYLVNHNEPDKADFDASKEKLITRLNQIRVEELIGSPKEIVNLRGEPGIWLQQKLKNAKFDHSVIFYDDYFNSLNRKREN